MSQLNPLKIQASENYITKGIALDLIATRLSPNKQEEIVQVKWAVNLAANQFTLYDNKLLLNEIPQDLQEVGISCTEIITGISVRRVFKVHHTTRSGKLVHFINNNTEISENVTWDIWSYQPGKASQAIDFSDTSDFGLVAEVTNNHVIVRKKTRDNFHFNEWAEQTSTYKLDMQHDNYYIIYGESKIYTALDDVIFNTNPRILYALMDQDKITARLSHEPLDDITFELCINNIVQTDATLEHNGKNIIITNFKEVKNLSHLITIKANKMFTAAHVTLRNYLDNFYYAANDLGVVFDKDSISLKLWAPTAKYVEVMLYNDAKNHQSNSDYCFKLDISRSTGTHHIQINRKQFEGKFYLYRIYFDQLDKHQQTATIINYAVDPYANAVSVNGKMGCLIDLNSHVAMPYNWETSEKPKATDNPVIYELHIRDFTISDTSNIKKDLRGKYVGAATSRKLHVKQNEELLTGIDSLVELGITHVHLLPISDFSSVDETKPNLARNWGYDPRNYNTPSGIYATNPYDPYTRIREFREMVQGFHKQGIRIIIDVVYNHMTNTINFDSIVPGYYFRSDHLGKFTNGSGCGNELASERPQVRKFILDSIIHWIKTYKIDGLRFDLMELIDLDTMKQIVETVKQIDQAILIYGEPWSGGSSPLINKTYRGSQKNQGFAIFNDYFRNAIRGNNSPGHGFINGNAHNPNNCHEVIQGLKGSIHNLTINPTESINYTDAHDNYTLWDHIEKSQNQNLTIGNYRQNLPENVLDSHLVRQNLLGLSIILTAQGIPFLQGGVEMLRTKQGDHNSYKSDDRINAFNWQDKSRFIQVFKYIQGLIKLRKEHSAFRIHDSKIIENKLKITMPNGDDKSGVIISHFMDNANNDTWQDIIVIYNATTIDDYYVNEFLPKPPKGLWYIVANHERSGTETIATSTPDNLPPLRSHSIMIIHS